MGVQRKRTSAQIGCAKPAKNTFPATTARHACTVRRDLTKDSARKTCRVPGRETSPDHQRRTRSSASRLESAGIREGASTSFSGGPPYLCCRQARIVRDQPAGSEAIGRTVHNDPSSLSSPIWNYPATHSFHPHSSFLRPSHFGTKFRHGSSQSWTYGHLGQTYL